MYDQPDTWIQYFQVNYFVIYKWIYEPLLSTVLNENIQTLERRQYILEVSGQCIKSMSGKSSHFIPSEITRKPLEYFSIQ